MTISFKDVWDVFQAMMVIVGFGVILHYYAFLIAWGIRKGMAKIPSVNQTNVILKTAEDVAGKQHK